MFKHIKETIGLKKGGQTVSDWNQKCLASIARNRREAELKYGIRIGQTEIFCSVCGKKWDFSGKNGCKGALTHTDMVGKECKPRKPLKRIVEGKRRVNHGLPGLPGL